MILALAFKEVGWPDVQATLSSFDVIYSCDLLDAEVQSAYRREGVALEVGFFAQLDVVLAHRSLHREYVRVLSAGYVRGADCYHLATALSLSPNPGELTFLTLDKRQRDVARALGFKT